MQNLSCDVALNEDRNHFHIRICISPCFEKRVKVWEWPTVSRIFSSRDRIRSVITFRSFIVQFRHLFFNGKYTEQDKCRDLILAKFKRKLFTSIFHSTPHYGIKRGSNCSGYE